MNSKNEIALFLGDSLVEYFPIEQLYKGKKKILNRGIAGSTTHSILKGLDQIIGDLTPDQAFIWLGTNDLVPGVPQNSEGEVTERVIQIADHIHGENPDAEIIILSLLPINDSDHPKISREWVAGRSNLKQILTNGLLQSRCEQKGYAFLDLYDAFLDGGGRLKIEYTVEGLHINDDGYRLVMDRLTSYL